MRKEINSNQLIELKLNNNKVSLFFFIYMIKIGIKNISLHA